MAKGGRSTGLPSNRGTTTVAFMGGGRILDSGLKPVIDKSPTPEIYQYFADLTNKHKVAPSSEVPAENYITNFGNGALGMYISGAWWGIDYIAPVVKGHSRGGTPSCRRSRPRRLQARDGPGIRLV